MCTTICFEKVASPVIALHPTIPPSYIRVRAVVWNAARDRRTDTQRDTQTAVTNTHFAWAVPRANEPPALTPAAEHN